MPNPFAVGGGPGAPDDSFLGLDSGNFWSRFGLPEPGGPPPVAGMETMGPVDAMPDSETPGMELEATTPQTQDPGAPLDALYSMIGMQPLTADSMGRYNLTDDQKSSASRNALSDTLGTAAQVMFGTASADDMVKSGIAYGSRRDSALDRSSAVNERDYALKVDMALKGSNLLKQQTIIEAEQEKLKSIMDQKEFGADWMEAMEPVWEKYANDLSAIDPDKAKEYAATLTMVKAKALSGDMAGATLLFDTATKSMVPSAWEKDLKEDMVRAQFARNAEFASFADSDAELQKVMPGWKMGMVGGKMVPMSPADQQKEANALDLQRAQASNYREVSANSSMQNQIMRSTLAEQKRIDQLARVGGGSLVEALAVLENAGSTKPADIKARAEAQGKVQEYTTYLQASGALSPNQSNWSNEIKKLAQSPQMLYNAIAKGATATSTVFQQLAPVLSGAGGTQTGSPTPAASAGAGGTGGPPSPVALTVQVNEGISMVGMPGGPSKEQILQTIGMIPDPQTQGLLKAELENKLAGRPTRPVRFQGVPAPTGTR